MRKSIRVLLSAVIAFIFVVSSIGTAYADSWKSESGKSFNAKQYEKYNSIVKKFNDVREDFWAYKAILELAKRGIINGYPDQSFKPNASVTRSEFATMLTKALDLKATDNIQTFVDVTASSWDYNAVEASKDYLTGYKTSTGALYFYGDRKAVREDMAVALVKALSITKEADNGQLQQIFKDYNSISTNLRDYVYTAYKNGLMIGSNGKFAPQDSLTRAEAATLLERALIKTGKVVVDDSEDVKVPVDTTTALSSLTYNGIAVPGFSPATSTYNVVLPAGTTAVPVVAAAVNNVANATANVTQAPGLPGSATVTVAIPGTATQTIYVVNFTVAAPVLNSDATLSSLTYNGAVVPGFSPSALNYNVVLPAGTTAIPVVAATVTDTGKAAAVVTQATSLSGYATIVVTAQDGVTVKVYTIGFSVAAPLSTDATVSSFTYNGFTVPGFNPATFNYNVVLPIGTTAVPVVAASVTDTGKATAVVTQAAGLPGYATVVVTAQDGVTFRVYTISFTVAKQ